MNYNHCMLDLEALSLTPDATILSISAMLFDPFVPIYTFEELNDNPVLDLVIAFEGQENRSINQSTIEWWAKQDQKVTDKMFRENDRTPLNDALIQLKNFVWNKATRIWTQGLSFDIPLLENAYTSFGMPSPWHYWQARDSRTLLDFVSVDQPTVTHDSVEDIKRQIIGTTVALHKLGIKEFVRK